MIFMWLPTSKLIIIHIINTINSLKLLQSLKEFVGYLKLKSGEHILDVGSGIGGGDFYMAEVS